MFDIFYNANTEEKFNKIIKTLNNKGYTMVGLNKNPSFKDCKKYIHGNAKLIIHAFYNSITNRNEIQFETKSIYESYPQYKGKIKIIDV